MLELCQNHFYNFWELLINILVVKPPIYIIIFKMIIDFFHLLIFFSEIAILIKKCFVYFVEIYKNSNDKDLCKNICFGKFLIDN